MVLETTKQTAILKKLRQIPNSFWFKPINTNCVGTPDIIGDINGKAFYIEVKRDEKGEPSDVQKYRINNAKKRGAISFCTYSWKDCYSKLREYGLSI